MRSYTIQSLKTDTSLQYELLKELQSRFSRAHIQADHAEVELDSIDSLIDSAKTKEELSALLARTQKLSAESKARRQDFEGWTREFDQLSVFIYSRKATRPLQFFKYFLRRDAREDVDIICDDLQLDIEEMLLSGKSKSFVGAVIAWQVVSTVWAYTKGGIGKLAAAVVPLGALVRYFKR